MIVNTDKINASLLFIISLCVTALAIYLFKHGPSGWILHVTHNFWQNVFFINITFLGSATFCFGLILYLFYKKHYAISRLIAGSTLISLLLIQIIKNYLNNNGIQLFFEKEQYIFDTANNVSLFVSSHTAIAFTLATILTLYFNDRVKAFFFFLLAFTVAFSRTYLAHHTLADLLAGAFTGIASGAISFYCYLYLLKFKNPVLFTSEKFSSRGIPANTFSIE